MAGLCKLCNIDKTSNTMVRKVSMLTAIKMVQDEYFANKINT